MLAINNQAKFKEIVKNALAKSANFPRWQSAINKAVVQIQLQPEFITWLPETKSIVIWNQESNHVHSANGVCDCLAFTKYNVPCFHRAMARLIRIYMETEEQNNRADITDWRTESQTPYFPAQLQRTRSTETIGKVRI